MARRRKTHHTKKTTTRRKGRRRVGAISGDQKTLLMQTLAGIGGAIAASYVTTAVTNAVSKIDSVKNYASDIGAVAPIAVGFFLPKIIKKQSPMMKGLQMGMMIGGGLSLVKALKILPGVGGVPFVAGSPAMQRTVDFRSQNVPMVVNMRKRRNLAAGYAMAV